MIAMGDRRRSGARTRVLAAGLLAALVAGAGIAGGCGSSGDESVVMQPQSATAW